MTNQSLDFTQVLREALRRGRSLSSLSELKLSPEGDDVDRGIEILKWGARKFPKQFVNPRVLYLAAARKGVRVVPLTDSAYKTWYLTTCRRNTPLMAHGGGIIKQKTRDESTGRAYNLLRYPINEDERNSMVTGLRQPIRQAHTRHARAFATLDPLKISKSAHKEYEDNKLLVSLTSRTTLLALVRPPMLASKNPEVKRLKKSSKSR